LRPPTGYAAVSDDHSRSIWDCAACQALMDLQRGCADRLERGGRVAGLLQLVAQDVGRVRQQGRAQLAHVIPP
jgi:hypothetical protein